MRDTLAGCVVLVVEDEPLIALDIIDAFEKVGADVLSAHSLAEAIRLVECGGVSAAVVDFGLQDKEAAPLCAKLRERNIFFIVHSGYTHLAQSYQGGVVIPKPAPALAIIDKVLNSSIECPAAGLLP